MGAGQVLSKRSNRIRAWDYIDYQINEGFMQPST